MSEKKPTEDDIVAAANLDVAKARAEEKAQEDAAKEAKKK